MGKFNRIKIRNSLVATIKIQISEKVNLIIQLNWLYKVKLAFK